MNTQALSTQQLLELTKTETDKGRQKAIVQELVSRGAATVITERDDLHSIRQKVMAVTPTENIPSDWLD